MECSLFTKKTYVFIDNFKVGLTFLVFTRERTNISVLIASGGPVAFFNSTEYIITIVHGVLLAALAILFMLSLITAILAGCCLKRDFSYHTTRQLTKEAVVQSR
jgi:hypothetical protein